MLWCFGYEVIVDLSEAQSVAGSVLTIMVGGIYEEIILPRAKLELISEA